MTAETNHNTPTLDDELNTTAPQSTPGAWRMPDPVFRKTSGRLPQGFKRKLFPETETQETLKPEVTDAGLGDNSTPQADSKPKSETLKIILVFLGLAAMIGFIVVFLTVVYFFFLR